MTSAAQKRRLAPRQAFCMCSDSPLGRANRNSRTLVLSVITGFCLSDASGFIEMKKWSTNETLAGWYRAKEKAWRGETKPSTGRCGPHRGQADQRV